MKRRNFLGVGIGAIGVPLVSNAGTSLYGTPGSVKPGINLSGHPKLTFAISRLGLPEAAASSLATQANLWFDILTKEELKRQFVADPEQFVADHGLQNLAHTAPGDLHMLAACCDPLVLDAANKQDYDGFFEALRAHGIDFQYKSVVSSRVDEIIRSDFENFSRNIEEIIGGFDPEEIEKFFTEEDIRVLMGGLTSAYQKSCTAIVGCVVAAAIAAIVVTYVSVVVAATVVLAVGVSITAAVSVAVTVSSSDTSSSSLSTSDAMRLQSYGSSVFDAFQRISRVAGITKAASLAARKYEEFVGFELHSVFDAAERQGLIQIEPGRREAVHAAVHNACMRMLTGQGRQE